MLLANCTPALIAASESSEPSVGISRCLNIRIIPLFGAAGVGKCNARCRRAPKFGYTALLRHLYSAGRQLILKWLRRTEHRWNCDRDESEELVHDIGYFAGWRSKERLNPPSHGCHRTFGPSSSLGRASAPAS